MSRKTTAKFHPGDTVFFSDRCPAFLDVKKRRRKVARVYYDPRRKCKYYILGSNHKEKLGCYGFRSYMLRPDPIGHRPRKE